LIPFLLSHCRKWERLDALQGLEQGRYPAIVANRVLDEGVDLPDVKVAIVIGGSSSPRQATQRLGRILRRSRFGRGTLYEIITRETRDVVR
jgi:superfamily II DNA or RNA helicase